MQRLIAPNKSAFLKSKYILESVVVAHEIVHSVHKSGELGLILKLDYEKAYDRVKRFSPTWCAWVKSLVEGGSLGVVLNGEDNNFFKARKGLRQGDPISPLLFNLVVDSLTRMLLKAARSSLVKGLLTNFIEQGIISLQYADDTILFSILDKSHLVNLKCILVLFERISGMRINFHKSEIVTLNVGSEKTHGVSHLLGCSIGNFPLKYLGVPLHFEKLSREDSQPLVDTMMKRIVGWRGKLLSYGARLVLTKSCLASIPVYLMSFIKFPKWAIKMLYTRMTNCLWNDLEGNRKYHLANWELVSMCKDYGGLGIPNLRDLNISPLGSWIKRYSVGEGKLWKEILDFKYSTRNPNIFAYREVGASQGSCLLQGQQSLVLNGKLGMERRLNYGRITSWGLLAWLFSSRTFILVNEKAKIVADLWDGESLKCTFRRSFDGELYRVWLEVIQLANTIRLSEGEDEMIWHFNSSRVYSSQSLYKAINFRGIHQLRGDIWIMFLAYFVWRFKLAIIFF
ncbi:hypothetical protein U9M48_011304 [Paspalum notatum var. saurae]|uniref:Reverse transcriptase domain-containing protein n=1 Tax=Paspalum notatum var. saurae TaxID=547442 RepID=A0AAQ3SX14_PASNO